MIVYLRLVFPLSINPWKRREGEKSEASATTTSGKKPNGIVIIFILLQTLLNFWLFLLQGIIQTDRKYPNLVPEHLMSTKHGTDPSPLSSVVVVFCRKNVVSSMYLRQILQRKGKSKQTPKKGTYTIKRSGPRLICFSDPCQSFSLITEEEIIITINGGIIKHDT